MSVNLIILNIYNIIYQLNIHIYSKFSLLEYNTLFLVIFKTSKHYL
jgi:hypothetical protein